MPGVEIEDAYEAHVRELHARDNIPKWASVKLPVEEMQSIRSVIAEAIRTTKLPAESERRWLLILRSLDTSILEAA